MSTTTVYATFRITIQSDNEMSETEVQDFLNDLEYQIGDEQQMKFEQGGTAQVADTEWIESNIIDD